MMHSDPCNIEVMKLKINGVQLFVASLTAMGTRMSYGITHCYTRFSDFRGVQG